MRNRLTRYLLKNLLALFAVTFVNLTMTESRAHSTETHQQLSSFFEGLDTSLKAYREVRKSFDRKIAFDFNSVDFFSPGEKKVSEILAFFLNPDATHGQGDTFLLCFFNTLDPKAKKAYNASKSVQVELEHRTDINRRIDITIRIGDDNYWVGIENKVGTAADQAQQIAHYSEYLRQQSKSETSDNNFTLFYLTPGGHNPSEHSISTDQRKSLEDTETLKNLNYSNDIIGLFENFEQKCEADNVRAFIRDFNKHLKQRFKGEFQMTENLIIKDYVKDNPMIFDTIDQLNNAVQSIQEDIRELYYRGIIEKIKTGFAKFSQEETRKVGSYPHKLTCFKKDGLTFRVGYSYYHDNITIHFFNLDEDAQEERDALHKSLKENWNYKAYIVYSPEYWTTWITLEGEPLRHRGSAIVSMLEPGACEKIIDETTSEIQKIVNSAILIWEKIHPAD